MNQPILTFRAKSQPYQALTALSYLQTNNLSGNLPVAADESSDVQYFRVYNNWAMQSSIATAFNVHITTYDGATAGSHTASKLPVSGCWVHFQEIGFGEGSSSPGGLSFYLGDDVPTGGSSNKMIPVMSSDGVFGVARIRAGQTGSGVGFIEFATYATTPQSVPDQSFDFSTTVDYEWSS